MTAVWEHAAAWAAYVDLPTSAADGTDLEREMGFVAIEFDAGGEPMSDGDLYTDLRVAQQVVDRRNALEGHSALLDRWFVLSVVATTADAHAAIRQANDLRAGRPPASAQPLPHDDDRRPTP